MNETQHRLYPLTSPQREIWFDQILHEGTPLYNIGGYVKIPGAINPVLFEQAVNLLVQKHDTLRTMLTEVTDEDGVPMQTYVEKLTVTVPVQDLTKQAHPHEAAMAWMQQRFIETFELTGQKLFRYDLVKISEQCYYWLIQYHRLIIDGYGVALLNRSMAEIYTHTLNGQVPNLDSHSYVTFVDNDRTYVESAVFDKQRQYWLSKYPTPPEPLLSPRYRYTDKLIGSGCEVLYLPRDFYNRLNELAKQHKATLFHLLLGALYVYFTRTAGRDDFAIGLPVLNRANAKFKKTAGLFTGVSPTLFNFGKDLSFAELLQQINKTLKANDHHQRFPASEINRAVGLRSQLFDINLSYENHDSDACFAGVDGQFIKLLHHYEQTPLMIFVRDYHIRSDVKLDFVFNLAYFNTDDIKAIQARFVTILEAVLKDSASPIHTLPVMTEKETKQLLAWNDTATDYPRNKTIVDLFEQQVETTPDNIAVVFEEQQLTYRELNSQANQLAHYLQSLGVKPEVLVGICVERSLEMVIGLLVILKAGGAYVPIDPSYPQARIAYMLEDTATPLLLTQSHLQKQLPELESECVVVCLDEVDFAVQETENLVVNRGATDLAYVIYTSGSTGLPKGVCVPHRAIVRLVKNTDYALFNSEQIFLQYAPISFDAATLEIWGALLNSAKLVVMPTQQKSLETLAEILQQKNISVLWLTSSLFNVMLEEHPASMRDVKQLMTGGEALSVSHIHKALQLLPYTQLINGYGPTENTTFTCCYPISNYDYSNSIPIGKPIANTQVFIVDNNYQPLPVGSVGELITSGEGLARGYLNRPELTAEKFIEVELLGKMERIYKTGDLARWLPDGNLEYLGRIDNQVKLRGFRIELGEIETLLSQHSAVKEAVVTLYETDDNKWLVAYITTDSKSNELVAELKDSLKASLPDYMIPSAFVVLDTLPLTPNGKIDRKALPAPESAAHSVSEYIAPRTEEEETLANIWATVLGLERIGIHDNFFELGGHSLLATQLIARIQETFDVRLFLQQLFDTPSVAKLSEYIQQVRDVKQDIVPTTLPTIVADSAARHQPFPLNDIQQAYWLGRSDTMTLGNVTPHFYLEIDCPLFDVQRLEQTWQHLIARHEMLRATVLPNGQQQILAQRPYYPFEQLDLSECEQQEKHKQLAQIRKSMSDRMFDATQWPLFEIRVTQLNTKTMRLHFSMDILIVDGWSFSVLSHEWWLLYQNPELKLEPLTLSFRDYVLASQAFYQETNIAYQTALNYWRNRLDTLPPAPQLPLIRLPESLEKPCFNARSFKLDLKQWQLLQQKTSKANVTPSALLLTIYADILALWSKSAHFTLNLTLFNRPPVHEQINRVVGDFTSLILLEIDNRQPLLFSERIKRVQQQLWQDLNYRAVDAVQVMREIASHNKGHHDMMPVVFTSMLVLDTEQSEGVLTNLGKQVFALGSTPQVWLDNVIMENPDGVECFWFSVDDLFPDGLLNDMFAAYRQHIEQLLNSDTAWQATHTQHLLPATDLALQREVNATKVRQSKQFMHSLFRAQVEKQPDRPAIINDEVCLSYSELHAAALQIGHWLRQQGVKRNQFVAVVMDKGWEQVVAVMGILYAGAAYVPIDSELPEQRQHFLLQETEAKIVLTQSKWQDLLHFPPTRQVLAVDRHDLPSCNALPELPDRDLSDLAYIIYTSGSTGNPKGVVIDHRGAVNTLVDINRRFQVTAQDRVLALSALNFDLSVYDVFGVLGAGGTLVIPNPAHRRDPQNWAALMVKHQVTLWNTVPALMQMLVDYQNGTQLDTPLRVVMMSGDWIPLTLPERIKQLWPNCQTISLGGATETSIWSIYHPIDSVDHSKNSIPYGKPLDNQTFYVLDERLEPRPLWIPGNLYIGGIGLAQGYWKDEAKTQASFIIHPQTKERLYKTGDLGRWLPDGNIEFLGREDAQVKVRGHRIELGEIETYLNRHPDLKEGVVMAVGEALQEKQLVAYIVPQKTSVNEDDYGTEAMKGTLTDSIERAAFKLRQPGIRQFADSRQHVALPSVTLNQNAYLVRQSYRHFQPMPVALDALSTLLASLQPMTLPSAPLPKYRYGSAGSLYPIQCYLYIKPDRVAGLEGGLYYYHPLEHRLILLTTKLEIDQTLHGGINQMIFAESAFSLFLISQMSAIEPMYGQMSRDFCLLEAGYMSQLLMDEAHHHDIGLCPIGGMQFEPIRPDFELSDDQEMLHSFLGGVISLEQKNTLPVSAANDAKSKQANPLEVSEDEVKAFLHQHLPSYMVPNRYVILEKLPLSSNGKVDRKSLPIPDLDKTTKVREAPANETEQQLMEMVMSILQIEAIGVTDNFFDIGADSLDFIKIYNAIKKHWKVKISVTDLFQLENVREIANLLDTLINVESDFEKGEL
jgi:amino acid adenylation domain-containing protein